MGDLQTLLPGFQNSVQGLHTALLAVCLVLGFAGLVHEVSLSYQRGSVAALPPYLVKVFVAFAALGLMQVWAGYLSGMVNDLNNQIGVNQGNVLARILAIHRRWFFLRLAPTKSLSPRPTHRTKREVWM